MSRRTMRSGLARQVGLAAAASDMQKSARIQVAARGVPKDGLDTTVAGDFGGVGLTRRRKPRPCRRAAAVLHRHLQLQSDDLDPLIRMVGLDIPGDGAGHCCRSRRKDQRRSARRAKSSGRTATSPAVQSAAKLTVTGLGAETPEVERRCSPSTASISAGSPRSASARLPLPTGDPAAPWSHTPFGDPVFGDLSSKLDIAREPPHRRPRLRRLQSRARRGRPSRSLRP